MNEREKGKWAVLSEDYAKVKQWFSEFIRQPDKDDFVKKLKFKRKEFSLFSSREFALEAGIDPSHYAKIEKGELPVTKNIMAKLVKRYNINVDNSESFCAMLDEPFDFGLELIIWNSLSSLKNAIEQHAKGT